MRAMIALSIFFPLFVFACSGEKVAGPELQPIEAATVGVKSMTIYPSLFSSQILSAQDFEYAGEGRLIKKTYWAGDREKIIHYELFSYGESAGPAYKLGYHANANSPAGFMLLDSTAYRHDGKFLISETTYYPCADYNERYAYRYHGNLLAGKTRYHNDGLESYTVYEYRDGRLHREVDYSKDSSMIESREYGYEGETPVTLTYYSFASEAKRRVSYAYNEAGKLVLEKVDELSPYSSSLPHVIRYSY